MRTTTPATLGDDLFAQWLKLAANPLNPRFDAPDGCTVYRRQIPWTVWRVQAVDNRNVKQMTDLELLRELAHVGYGCEIATDRGRILANEVERRGLITNRELIYVSASFKSWIGARPILVQAVVGDKFDVSQSTSQGDKMEVWTYRSEDICSLRYAFQDGLVVGQTIDFCNDLAKFEDQREGRDF